MSPVLSGFARLRGCTRSQRLYFSFQVNFCVDVRRVKGDMAQPARIVLRSAPARKSAVALECRMVCGLRRYGCRCRSALLRPRRAQPEGRRCVGHPGHATCGPEPHDHHGGRASGGVATPAWGCLELRV